METQNKFIAILDTVGRTVIGEREDTQTTEQILAIKNPVILHVEQQDQMGRMSVKLFPIIFREFLGDKASDSLAFYKKASITETNVDAFDYRLKSQYDQMFNKNNVFTAPSQPTPQPSSGEKHSPAIINLFDEA
jgi:hypothetical protein